MSPPTRRVPFRVSRLALACAIPLAAIGVAHAQTVNDAWAPSRLERLEQRLEAQAQRLDTLERTLAVRDREIAELRDAVDVDALLGYRGRGVVADAQQDPVVEADPRRVAAADADTDASASGPPPTRPVGRAPDIESRPPEIARIFDQPSVLTPDGDFVLEPSLQFGYSSNDRVALVGYTVIPAILIGLIDVRQVKTTSATLALTGRYGLTRRLELETRVPFSYVSTDTVSREIFTGTAQDRVFEASGSGLGDVEATVRYQLNEGDVTKPFYVGWLRYKSRTGRDPFEVVTDCVQRCVGNATGTGLPLELATGSGFEALQTGVTWLYASDPAVFFGNFSYLHNFKRKDVMRQVLNGEEESIGEVEAGDIIGFNVGVGLALNEKASLSLGYDQSIVGRTQQNGRDLPGSVRMVMDTLLVGASYRFSDRLNLNFSLGVGVTRDTPDLSLSVRTPITF